MSRLRSFTTLLCMILNTLARPVADDNDDDDSDGDCWSQSVDLIPPTTVPDSPSPAILAPYQLPPTPRPSPSQIPHATLPVSHRKPTSVILGSVFGVLIALVAFFLTARYVIRRRRDPFKDPPKQKFAIFRFRPRVTASKRRLSDESWVSPILPDLIFPKSPLLHELELRQCPSPQRRLVPITTPVCTPTDTEFGSRADDTTPESLIAVPPVRVPSPVYISPFSPSPSNSSSPSSLSPTPSTEPLTSPARLSRLLSSTFRGSCEVESPVRPSTAYFIQTSRSYAQAYYHLTSPTGSVRLVGTRSRTGFYPGLTDDALAAWERVRDTFSTVTTTDTTCTLHAVTEDQSIDLNPRASVTPSASISTLRSAQVGTSLGLKVRLSDASEHARYRLREKERERERQLVKERFSTESVTSMDSGQREFRLRDSETVLREIGW